MFDRLDTTAEMTPDAIRRLQHGDADRVAAFVAALDQDTLQLRFGSYISAAAIHAHYAGLNWNAAVLLAWNYGAEPGSQIGGLAEVYLYPKPAGARPDACEAEIAMVVTQGLRGRGVGRLLLSSGIAAAAQRGAVRSTLLLSAGDHALARMAVRLGFTVDAAGDRAVLVHQGDIGGPDV